MSLDPITATKIWLLVRPIRRLRQWRTRRKMRSWYEEHGIPHDEIPEDFHHQDEDVSMDALKGGLKSKLVWLGLAQVAYGIFQLWATGDLSPETAGPVISGALTVALRAITNTSLADKVR